MAVHGGAGQFRFRSDDERRAVVKGLVDAVEAGLKALATGSALDAVTEAVSYMEDSGLFNAGRGSVYTITGDVEQDAGIMDGRSMRIGAVASVKNVVNAVKLARFIMENTDHVLIVGDGALELAKLAGLFRPSSELYNDAKNSRFREVLRMFNEGRWRFTGNRGVLARLGIVHETVGAVALDKDGNLAAATSTGGVWLKMSGRVGDSPIPGAGFWAKNGVGAFSATGIGEVIIRSMACIRASIMVEQGMGIGEALRRIVEEVTNMYGPGNIGILGIDAGGNVASAFNTEAMARAWGRVGGVVKVAINANDPWP